MDDEQERFQEEDHELDQAEAQPKVVKKKKKKKKKKKPKPKEEAFDDLDGADGILTQMEEDAIAKSSKRRSGAPATAPGAVASGSSEMEAVSQLEQDAMAKARRRGNGPSVPGAVTADSDRQAAIQNIEEDLMAKSRSRGSGGAQIAGAGATTDSSIIRQVEGDMMEKKRFSNSPSGKVAAAAATTAIAAGGADGHHMRDLESEDFKASGNIHKDLDEEAPLNAPFDAAGAASDPGLGRPAAAEGEYPGLNDGDEAGEALQAFVAEEEVVEATGVAVLMSEEEEEKLEKRRNKRYLIFGVLAFIVIVVAVVVPVVVVAGGGGDGDVIENEPSVAPSPVPSFSPSAAPSSIGLGSTVDFLVSNGISDEEALADKESPQYKAADWIANQDPLELDFNNPDENFRWLQRYRLATFYFATNGENWRECGRQSEGCSGGDNREWLVAEEECGWFALRCNGAAGVVDVINFNNPFGNFLKGELPDELFQLTDLVAFLVQSNNITGTISESWGQLSNLAQVFLHSNQFFGTVPDIFWQNLQSLDRVLLNNNQFEGQVSPLVSGLPLRFFRMDNNNMNGSIPEELFDVTSLIDLRLDNNEITGTMSERFGDLTLIEILHLAHNKLSGPIPGRLGELRNLRELELEMNDLTGSIPFSVCTIPGIDPPHVDCDKVDCPNLCCDCF